LPSTSLAGARGQAQSHGQVLPNRPGVAPLLVPATSTASPGSTLPIGFPCSADGPTYEVTTGEVRGCLPISHGNGPTWGAQVEDRRVVSTTSGAADRFGGCSGASGTGVEPSREAHSTAHSVSRFRCQGARPGPLPCPRLVRRSCVRPR
jgi:hypothetical protein